LKNIQEEIRITWGRPQNLNFYPDKSSQCIVETIMVANGSTGAYIFTSSLQCPAWVNSKVPVITTVQNMLFFCYKKGNWRSTGVRHCVACK
jgi:hypothetical protein